MCGSQVVKAVHQSRPSKREMFRALKVVEDTPENLKDILRWADALGYPIEERRPGEP